MSTDNTSVTTFSSFDLPKPLSEALEIMRYREPTPIQIKGIPVVMEGKDMIGIAQTGTGKTAAFGIPMVKALYENKDAQALILVPTRELAMQIYEVARQLTQNIKNMKPWVLVGGTSMYAQVKSLPRKPRIIIATPGRLMDHLDKRTFSLSDLKIAVLDEADRMLDIGFEPQIRRIFQNLPKERQTLLFSATFPKTIERLTREYMNHPVKVTVGKVSEPAKEIEQSFVHTTTAGKNQLLINELNERKGSILIFVRTKHKVDRIARMLMDENFEVDRIHGARTQGQRNRVIQDFRTMKIRILVATDVASRGLDIPHIEHVINFDIPEVPEDYVHRIGRTARAGAKGKSISFLTNEDKTKWMYLSRHLNALGVKTSMTPIKATTMAVVKTASIMDKPDPLTATADITLGTKEPTVEYKKPRTYDRKRPFGSAPRGTGRTGRTATRSFSPREENTDSRPSYGRPDFRGPRSDTRPSYGRSGSRGPRLDSRGPRSDAGAPRNEGRSFAPRGPRSDSRPSYGRPDFRGPRSDARPSYGRTNSRGPRSDDGAGRSEGRSFSPRADRPAGGFDRPRAPRGEGRSFAPRGPRSDSRPSYGRTDSRGPRSDSRPSYGRTESRGPSRSTGPRSTERSFAPRGTSSGRTRTPGARSFARSDRPSFRPGK
jgi:ATP-dependent RNA helicase DeaD